MNDMQGIDLAARSLLQVEGASFVGCVKHDNSSRFRSRDVWQAASAARDVLLLGGNKRTTVSFALAGHQ